MPDGILTRHEAIGVPAGVLSGFEESFLRIFKIGRVRDVEGKDDG
jgi:hypothetical protein